MKGDAAENGGIPAGAAAPAKPDPAARSASAPTALAQRNPSAANASANAPLTPSPQSAPASDPAPPIRLAATNAVRTAPSAGGDYLVQVSSQKNEADVQALLRALQNKFPAALGSRPPVIKRADLGDKGVYYRTMVGPFGSTEEAAQFCGNLKRAGGQCVIQKMAKSSGVALGRAVGVGDQEPSGPGRATEKVSVGYWRMFRQEGARRTPTRIPQKPPPGPQRPRPRPAMTP